MSYIWKEYSSDITYRAAYGEDILSPFIEDSYDIDYYNKAHKIRYVNPVIRFIKIFAPIQAYYRGLSLEEQKKFERVKNSLDNVLFHMLAQLDRKRGIHWYDVQEWMLEQDITSGFYGEKVKKLYEKQPVNYQSIIVKYLRRYNKFAGRKMFFREAVTDCFDNVKIYFYEHEMKFLIYLPQIENTSDKELLELLEWFFLDATANVRVFWQYHFGIIGRSTTMRIGNIAIY